MTETATRAKETTTNAKETGEEPEETGAESEETATTKAKKKAKKGKQALAGRVLMTSRDARALRWVAEQYGVRRDVLRVLLATTRDQGDPWRGSEPAVSERTAQGTLDRWERAGWVTRTRFYRETWITPTRAALALVRDPDELHPFEPWTAAATKLQHVHATNLVRLFFETSQPEVVWTSERVLRRELVAQVARQVPVLRVPDGEVELQILDQVDRVAVEVELHRKSRDRYREIIRSYPHRWHEGLWFAPDHDVRWLQGMLDDVLAAERRGMSGVVLRKMKAHPLPVVGGLDYGALL